MRTALITGAGSGIGRAVARALLERGDGVVLAGRRASALEETAAGFTARALIAPTDVSDPASVARLFDATRARFGRLDVLFNNAGVFAPPTPLEDVSFAEWSRVVGANLTGPFLCLQHAFRLMKAQTPQGGRIINNGSISSATPRPQAIAYTATKHAVTGLTKSAALDGRAYGIAVGQIDIGNALTAMAQPMAAGVLQADGSMRAEPTMDVAHVVSTVLHMMDLPLDANALFVTVMATAMPFVGRG